MIETKGRLVYFQPMLGKLEDREPDVIIERHGDSYGIYVPMDGEEFCYFTEPEVRMLIAGLASLLGDGE